MLLSSSFGSCCQVAWRWELLSSSLEVAASCFGGWCIPCCCCRWRGDGDVLLSSSFDSFSIPCCCRGGGGSCCPAAWRMVQPMLLCCPRRVCVWFAKLLSKLPCVGRSKSGAAVLQVRRACIAAWSCCWLGEGAAHAVQVLQELLLELQSCCPRCCPAAAGCCRCCLACMSCCPAGHMYVLHCFGRRDFSSSTQIIKC
jgi:hypothetical protein